MQLRVMCSVLAPSFPLCMAGTSEAATAQRATMPAPAYRWGPGNSLPARVATRRHCRDLSIWPWPTDAVAASSWENPGACRLCRDDPPHFCPNVPPCTSPPDWSWPGEAGSRAIAVQVQAPQKSQTQFKVGEELTDSDVGVDGASDADHNSQTQQQRSPVPVLVLELALRQLLASLQTPKCQRRLAPSTAKLPPQNCHTPILLGDAVFHWESTAY